MGYIGWVTILTINGFLWDNSNSHLSYLVTQVVEIRNGPTNFISIPRPPYQPKYG